MLKIEQMYDTKCTNIMMHFNIYITINLTNCLKFVHYKIKNQFSGFINFANQ